MIFYLIAGIDYAAHSWITHERAANSPWMPIIYPFKTVIPLTAAMLIDPGCFGVHQKYLCLEEGGMEMSKNF